MPPKILTGSEMHEVNACNKSFILNMNREHTVFIIEKSDSPYLIKQRFKELVYIHGLKGC